MDNVTLPGNGWRQTTVARIESNSAGTGARFSRFIRIFHHGVSHRGGADILVCRVKDGKHGRQECPHRNPRRFCTRGVLHRPFKFAVKVATTDRRASAVLLVSYVDASERKRASRFERRGAKPHILSIRLVESRLRPLALWERVRVRAGERAVFWFVVQNPMLCQLLLSKAASSPC